MQKISIKDARTNLSEIVEEVSEGQKEYVITKYGKNMARISSIEKGRETESARRKRVWEDLQKIAESIDTKGINYRELIENGRRY